MISNKKVFSYILVFGVIILLSMFVGIFRFGDVGLEPESDNLCPIPTILQKYRVLEFELDEYTIYNIQQLNIAYNHPITREIYLRSKCGDKAEEIGTSLSGTILNVEVELEINNECAEYCNSGRRQCDFLVTSFKRLEVPEISIENYNCYIKFKFSAGCRCPETESSETSVGPTTSSGTPSEGDFGFPQETWWERFGRYFKF